MTNAPRIRHAFETKPFATDGQNRAHRLLLELDEVCNSCPLPALLNYVGESAGLGVNILATVQAFSQFDVVYGPKYADALAT
jgi:hypothetical protein